MLRILYLCVALLLAPLVTQADVISKSEKDGPVRLVCMNPDGLVAHVEKLTRNQIIGVRYAALAGEIKWPCDDVQLPVGTVIYHQRWLQTEDKWWVLAQTVQYPNGSRWVTVDPMQATYHQIPIQWSCHYLDYCIPVVPDNHPHRRDYYDRGDRDDRRDYYDRDERHDRRKSHPRSDNDLPAGSSGMTIEEGQAHIRRQLGLPPKE